MDLDGTGSLTTRYLRGDVVDQLFARVENGDDAYWYLTDRQGSIRQVLDDTGAVVKSLAYDGYGNITSETGAGDLGRYAYTSREWDAEIEMQYNRARYYDASTGRWTSQDPLGYDAGDSNLYRYVHNRPTGATDPSGLQVPGWIIAAAGTEEVEFKRFRIAEYRYISSFKEPGSGREMVQAFTRIWEEEHVYGYDFVTKKRFNKDRVLLARTTAKTMFDVLSVHPVLLKFEMLRKSIRHSWEDYKGLRDYITKEMNKTTSIICTAANSLVMTHLNETLRGMELDLRLMIRNRNQIAFEAEGIHSAIFHLNIFTERLSAVLKNPQLANERWMFDWKTTYGKKRLIRSTRREDPEFLGRFHIPIAKGEISIMPRFDNMKQGFLGHYWKAGEVFDRAGK